MIRPAAIVIGFGLTLLAGKAANIVAGAGLNPRASSVGVLQLLPARATARDGGFYLSSGAALPNGDAVLSVGAVGSADPRPDAGASAYMDARSRTDGPTPSAPDRLLSAIEFVESRGRADAVGDGGRAVGILQIHAILVRDCQRLAPRERFTLADRTDPERSRRMFEVYQSHYNPTGDPERGARIWNGGPDGWRQDSTLDYWRRVKAAMEEQHGE